MIVDTHKGVEIKYDKGRHECYCDLTITRGKFDTVVKSIDEHLSKNFPVFKIQKVREYSDTVTNLSPPIEVVGLRKDKAFTIIDTDGKRSKLNGYYEKEYILHNEAHDPITEKLQELEKEEKEALDAFKKRKREILDELGEVVWLKDYKKKFLGEE